MRIGCLLLHGLGGSPFEMEELGNHLKVQGYDVEIPCLPGHGTTIQDLTSQGFDAWFKEAEKQLISLRNRVDRLFCIGLSMGGSLTLKLAQNYEIDGIVVIATPLYLYRFFPWEVVDWRLPFVHLLKHITPVVHTGSKSPLSREIAPWQGYEGVYSLHALSSFGRGLAGVRQGMRRITCPLLIIHSPKDKLSPVAHGYEILERVSSSSKQLKLLPIEEQVTSHHLLTTHRETKDKVKELTCSFIQKH